MKTDTKKLVLSGVFLALGLVLPFLTMQIPSIGNMLLPMHIPVLLCGFVCGAPYGCLVGFFTPLVRSMLFGMPKLFPMAAGMAFAGLFYKFLRKNQEMLRMYASLILAMLGGRMVWAVAAKLFYTMAGMNFTVQIFVASAFLNAVPGIIIQLVLIPAVVYALKKAGVRWNEYEFCR